MNEIECVVEDVPEARRCEGAARQLAVDVQNKFGWSQRANGVWPADGRSTLDMSCMCDAMLSAWCRCLCSKNPFQKIL